jgi:hypothetical protein
MEEKDFVEQAVEPITDELEIVVEQVEEAVVEPAPEVAPVPEAVPTATVVEPAVDYEKEIELARLKAENDSYRYHMEQQQVNQMPAQQATPQPGVPPIPDPYSETYQADLAAYTQYQSQKAVAKVAEEYDTRMKSLELIQGQAAWDAGVAATQAAFPDFNVEVEGIELQKVMQVKGVSLLEAKQLKEYDALANKLQQLQQGAADRQDTQTINPAATSTTNPVPDNTIKIKLTEEEKKYALRTGKTLDEYARMKHNLEKSQGRMPV